jgi:hypothetical protein
MYHREQGITKSRIIGTTQSLPYFLLYTWLADAVLCKPSPSYDHYQLDVLLLLQPHLAEILHSTSLHCSITTTLPEGLGQRQTASSQA